MKNITINTEKKRETNKNKLLRDKRKKNKLYFFILNFIILNLISCIFSKKIETNIKRNLQETYSEITLKISGGGTQQILNSYFIPIPYYLEVNSVPKTFNYTITDLEYDQNNIIIMKFNKIITSCENMFSGLSNINQINLTNFDFTEVTSMKGMFYGNSNLRKLNFNINHKISKITNLENAFKGCNLLESIDLSMLDTSLVTNMANMFRECYSLQNLNVSHFNTIFVTDMEYMFYGCGLLTSLNINNFNTASVTNMASMFNSCYQLKSLNLINFNTNLVNDMNSMFSHCYSLSSLNLSNFDTSLVSNMSNLFNGCNNLQKIDLSNFKTDLVTDMSYMFNGCTELTKLNLSKFNTSLVNNMEYIFGNCFKLISLEIENFDTILVTNMKFMFYECNSITKLNINKFDTNLVNNMQNIFSGCKSLLSIDLSNFKTSSVNNMEYMFSDCQSLTSLNLINFDTSLVANMEFMFYGCINLKEINLSNFNTSLVYNMNSMFYNCNSLTYLNLSNFITSKVINMQSMFYGCSNLKILDISNFDTSLVTDMNSMFFKCKELTSFNLYHFNFASVNYMGSMFYSCNNMNYINIYHFQENEIINVFDLFIKGTDNLKYCISDEENSPKIISEINTIKNKEREKTIKEKNKCIDKCSNDDIYRYDYNNICYIECPKPTSVSNNNNYLCEPLKCNKYYNYEKTECLDYIPDGFFLNNSNKGTIDKCHPDCKTCHKKEINNNTNCDSCLNSKYFDLGNCLTSCPNNLYFEDTKNNMTNLICKCSYNIKCQLCTLESIKYNLCLSCNNDEGYFPKENDETNNNSFINCYKDLEGYYLDCDNIYRECYSTCSKCNKGGDIINNNCIECITTHSFRDDFNNDTNCYKNCLNYYYFDLEGNYFCTKKKECPKIYNKFIKDKNKCIDECYKDNIYKYEYENECYKKCPEGTDILVNNTYLCELICEKNILYIDLENKNCLEKCEPEDFFNGKCGLYKPNLVNQQDYVKYIISEIENGKMDSILTNMIDNDLTIRDNNLLYQIKFLDNEININTSNIQLKKCEEILKQKNNIIKRKKLLLFKTDYYINGLLIPIVDYIIFNPDNYKKIDLNNCLNEKIDIYSPVNIDENVNNLFIYNPKSEFYNDSCFPYKTDFGTDITLKDRKLEFNNNYISLCEKNCKYKEYKSVIKKVICECKIKNESSLLANLHMNKDHLIYQFMDVEETKNSKSILKCHHILFTNEGLEANIPSYIIIVFFILYTFQLCFLRKKMKDNNFGKRILIKNEIDKIDKVKINPPRKNVKTKSTLLKDLRSSFMQRYVFKKPTFQIKSSKSINSQKSLKNQDIYNSIIENARIEEEKEKNIMNNLKDSELNILPYEKAKKYDKRTFLEYYISLIKNRYLLFLSFSHNEDYFSAYINRCILINSFPLFYLFNALFFTESTLHEIYIYKSFKMHLSTIFYSTLISSIIVTFVRYLSLPTIKLYEIEKEISTHSNKIIKSYKCKNNLVFILMYIFMIFSWYYLSSFCAVYRNSQIFLLENVLICYSIFLVYPFIYYLIPGFFRISSLSHTKKNSECFYNMSKLLQLF